MGLLPTLRARRLYDVSVEALKEMGISLVLLDMDNTLAPWHSTEVSEESREWIRKVQGESITVALFTNSAGGNADIIGKSVNIPVYKNAKKPFKAASLRLMKELLKTKKPCQAYWIFPLFLRMKHLKKCRLVSVITTSCRIGFV